MNFISKQAVIIEDEEALQDFLEMFLEEEGYIVSTFGSIEELENKLNKVDLSNVDLLFLDLNLPGKNGMPFLRELAVEFAPKLTIISSGDPVNSEELPTGKVIRVILKPFNPQDILNIIN